MSVGPKSFVCQEKKKEAVKLRSVLGCLKEREHLKLSGCHIDVPQQQTFDIRRYPNQARARPVSTASILWQEWWSLLHPFCGSLSVHSSLPNPWRTWWKDGNPPSLWRKDVLTYCCVLIGWVSRLRCYQSLCLLWTHRSWCSVCSCLDWLCCSLSTWTRYVSKIIHLARLFSCVFGNPSNTDAHYI